MSQQTMVEKESLIRNAYAAFNARDIDSILKVLDPKVKWTKAWEGDYAIGHDEVRAYWTRQWSEIDPRVTPVAFHERENGSLEVEVDQSVRDLDGKILFEGKVKHIYTIEDGLLKQMDVEKID